jgi:hypothetical protein
MYFSEPAIPLLDRLSLTFQHEQVLRLRAQVEDMQTQAAAAAAQACADQAQLTQVQ